MDKGTFGSPEKYKSLDFLNEKIGEMDTKDRKHLLVVINNFNNTIKKFENVDDYDFKSYLLKLVHQDYLKRIDTFLVEKYDKKIISHLKTFLSSKIKNSKRNILSL